MSTETDVNPETKVDETTEVQSETSFEVPRPSLTLREAAAILGKSLRSLERSILGKWGNKLPAGWSARKVDTESGQEWRIVPPAGFRLRHIFQDTPESDEKSEDKAPESKRRLPRHVGSSIESPAIVIDRTDEVENLLRELLQVQRQLSEERRLRMEDLRLITQMQGSMRLLETNANETERLKGELVMVKNEFQALKVDYLAVVNTPWWKRLFRK
jgi:hypothetical protein